LVIEGLRTHFSTHDGVVKAVDGVDLEVPAGRTLCVVGESGCGKSVTARSILGLVDSPGRIVDGRIWWRPYPGSEPVDLAGLDPRGEQMRRIRGGGIGMVFQEPMASLSPMYSIGDHLVETIRLHLHLSPAEARIKAIDDLARVGIPRPEQRFDAYPFQLSGGMCQRAMIALALSCNPSLLIADEPTTALDVTTQAQILDLLGELREQTGMAVMFITHDLGVVAEVADEVTVMYLGTVVEHGPVNQIFEDAQHPYTRALLRSMPMMGARDRDRLTAIAGVVPHPGDRPTGCPFHPRCPEMIAGLCESVTPEEHTLPGGRGAACHLLAAGMPDRKQATVTTAIPVKIARDRPRSEIGGAPLLEVKDLRMHFPVRKGFLGRTVGHVRAVDDVDLTIYPGETLGLVGESGCGKTTLGRCVARALQPTSGQIHYRHPPDRDTPVDLAQLTGQELRQYRGQVRVIFQDPFSSLNPRMTLLQLLSEPLRRIEGSQADSTVKDRVADMLKRVDLRPEYMRRYPHAFSGGERQRINIARALITNPRLVIADEAVSALDVSVRAQILNLLRDLQDEYGLTYLFISHDLSVVDYLCDRVAVMYLGKIVEAAETQALFNTPRHPYTEALLSAVPNPDPRKRGGSARIRLTDDPPDPTNPPPGCPFHTRCPHVQTTRCSTEVPYLEGAHHPAACHYTDELILAGVAREPK
jgi:peptide/nickel transport system ATP-binding protein